MQEQQKFHDELGLAMPMNEVRSWNKDRQTIAWHADRVRGGAAPQEPDRATELAAEAATHRAREAAQRAKRLPAWKLDKGDKGSMLAGK